MESDNKSQKNLADNSKEYLVVSLPEDAQPGSTLRLLRIEKNESAAKNAVSQLEADVLGLVTIVERKATYLRRPAVESIVV